MGVWKAVVDLDLIADLGGRPLVIGRGNDAPLRARGIADRYAAVTCSLGPIFQMQVELAEIFALGIEPRLRVDPALELLRRRQRTARRQHFAIVSDALAEQSAFRHHGPLAIADHF